MNNRESADHDAEALAMLNETIRRAMSTATGAELDALLVELGWHDMLDRMPGPAIRMVFRALGETGTHAPLLNDVMLRAARRPLGGTTALPAAGARWIVWERNGTGSRALLDPELPLRLTDPAEQPPLADGRTALAWWLLGSAHAMLALARRHALQRKQFGRPIATFQAVRHHLAETLVAIEGAEATLEFAHDSFGALLGKAAAGRVALTAARHCQQVLGATGFTAEHDLHRHIRRVLTLDSLLGSSRELSRQAGTIVRTAETAPRIAQLGSADPGREQHPE